MDSIWDIILPFAQSIHAKCVGVETLPLSVSQKRRFVEAIRDDIKKCSNFFWPEASESALAEAKTKGIDLWSAGWHDQNKFDPGKKIFHLEHVKPVSAIARECLHCQSPDDVRRVLFFQIRVAWVLKSEDDRLTALGFKSRRPDPDAAYAHAEIKLCKKRRAGWGKGLLTIVCEDDEHLKDFVDYM